jgi:hypothetical protein
MGPMMQLVRCRWLKLYGHGFESCWEHLFFSDCVSKFPCMVLAAKNFFFNYLNFGIWIIGKHILKLLEYWILGCQVRKNYPTIGYRIPNSNYRNIGYLQKNIDCPALLISLCNSGTGELCRGVQQAPPSLQQLWPTGSRVAAEHGSPWHGGMMLHQYAWRST